MAKKTLKRYKKLIITHDCLVPKGAMQVESVFKEDGYFNKMKTPIYKFDDAEQVMYNIMVKFGKEDSQGWILDDKSVRNDALMDYQKNGDKILKFTHQKDENGEPYEINAHVLETYIVKEGDAIFPDHIDSIARSAYFPDKEEYETIKALQWESSIEGNAILDDVEVEAEKTVDKAMRKIKDLLRELFEVKEGKLVSKSFDELIEIVAKDFDTVLQDRQNNDLYFATTAFATAVYDAEWKYLYTSEKDIDGLKKEIGKTIKQYKKYIDAMTFEFVEKENELNNEGDETMDENQVREIAKQAVIEALGIEENQKLADVIAKAIGDKEPSALPVVKDEEGNEHTVGEILLSLQKSINKNAEDLEAMKKDFTDNHELPGEGEDDEPNFVEKSDVERKADVAL